MFKKLQTRFFPYLLPGVFFLLPWQSRLIFSQATIAGEPSQFGITGLYLVEALIVLVFSLYGALRIQRQYYESVALLFSLLIVSFFSITWAFQSSVALGQFVHLLIAGMLFLLLLDKRTGLRKVAIGFIAGLIVPIGLGVWQVVTGGSGASTLFGLALRDADVLGDAVTVLEGGTRILRAYGSFSHPNIFGGFLVVGMVSLLLFQQKELRGAKRSMWWGALTVLLLGLLLTYSQSAWLALIVALLCGIGVLRIFQHAKQKYIKVFAGLLTICILLSSIFGVLVLNRFDVGQSSISERAEQYQEWPSVVPDSILLGSGLQNYTYAIEDFDPHREWWKYQPVHNVPMLVIGELGLVGLAILAVWILSLDKINFQHLPKRGPTIALMMGCALLVVSGLDHYLWTQWSGLALTMYVMAFTARSE